MNIVSATAGFWSERSARERLALLAAVAFVFAAALYAFLWEPGLAARKALAVTLPQLRAQVQDMRWQREEIARLRKQLGSATRSGDAASLLRASVARTSFSAAAPRIESLPNSQVRLRAESVQFDAWVSWLGELQRELGLRLESCRVVALDQPGMVQVEATFALQGATSAGTSR